MGESCIWIPMTRGADGREAPSRLFTETFDRTGDRELAKQVWSLSRLGTFRSKVKGIEYGPDGEATFGSLERAGVIASLANDRDALLEARREAGAVDSKGRDVTYRTQYEAVAKANAFNMAHADAVADVVRRDDGYIIEVARPGLSNATTRRALLYGDALYGRIRDTLVSLGFDVGVFDEPAFAGMFDPHNMGVTAEGYRTVIRIFNGSRGLEALPEEYAHLMVAGLRKTELASRLIAACRDEGVMRKVLGEGYADYEMMYGGDRERLAEETAGKLLADHVRSGETHGVDGGPLNLVRRFWEYLKGLFRGRTEDDVERMMFEANEAAADLYRGIDDGSLLPQFDDVELLDSERLYSIGSDLRTMRDYAEEMLERARTRYDALSVRNDGKGSPFKAIKSLEAGIRRGEYVVGCAGILTDLSAELVRRNESLGEFRMLRLAGAEIDEGTVLEAARHVRDLEKTYANFHDLIESMCDFERIAKEEGIIISHKDMEMIVSNARKAKEMLDEVGRKAVGMKYDLCYEFLKRFWKGDVKIDIGPNRGGMLTLEMVMNEAMSDVSMMDALFSSLSTSGSAFLSLIDSSFRTHLQNRDEVSMGLVRRVRAMEQKRAKAKFRADFMMERDGDGQLTGRYLSPVDWARYERERQQFADYLEKESGLSGEDVRRELDTWEKERCERVKLDDDRYEWMPKISMYGRNGARSHFDFESLGLTPEQLEYYREAIAIKMEYDAMLPKWKRVRLFDAPQVMKDKNEMLYDTKGRPRSYARERWRAFKQSVVLNANDTEWGQLEEERDEKSGKVRMRASREKRVPIHYVNRLKDMSLLSTDVGGSLIAYGAMAANFAEMSRITDMYEILRDYTLERRLDMHKGENVLTDAINMVGNIFARRADDGMRGTYIMKMLDHYLDKGLYGMSRVNENIGRVNAGKVADDLRLFYSRLGLGLNPFAGLNNWLAGKTQIFLESMAGEFYGVKDAAWAQKEFNKEILGSIADSGSPNPTNKLKLMMEEFDGQFQFNEALRRNKFYNGRFQRIYGRGSLLAFMTAGLYDLHACNLLGLFSRRKVMLDGRKVRLWEAYETHTDGNGVTSVRLKDNVTDLDGTVLSENGHVTEAYETMKRTMKERVRKVGEMCNGAYNEQDIGLVHQYALGRMLMQFRQWIPEHINRRYGRAYYDAALGTYREGFHMTNMRLAANCIRELVHGRFKAAIEVYSMTPKERANMVRSWTEIGTYALLCVVSSLIHDKDDKSKDWAKSRNVGKRAFAYVLDRTKTEMGAFVPWRSLAVNFLDMAKNPVSCMSGMEALVRIFFVWHIMETMEGGTYDGWNRYLVDLIRAVPGVNSMFKVYERLFAEPKTKSRPRRGVV